MSSLSSRKDKNLHSLSTGVKTLLIYNNHFQSLQFYTMKKNVVEYIAKISLLIIVLLLIFKYSFMKSTSPLLSQSNSDNKELDSRYHLWLSWIKYSNWKLLSPVVTTVDCRNWKEQIDLASHEIGLPQIKDENEVLSFEVSFYDCF